MNTRFSLPILLFISSFVSTNLFSQNTIETTIDQLDATKLVLTHLYADSFIKTWDKDYIEIIGKARITGSQEEKFKLEYDREAKTVYVSSFVDMDDIKKESMSYSSTTTDENGRTETTKTVNGEKYGFEIDVELFIKVPKNMALEVNSTYGKIQVTEISQTINLSNTYGEAVVKFDNVADNSFIESTYNEVEVYIPPSQNVDLTAKSGYGTVYSDLDFDSNHKSKSGHCDPIGSSGRAKMNNGGKALRISSGYNDIYIRTKTQLPKLSN